MGGLEVGCGPWVLEREQLMMCSRYTGTTSGGGRCFLYAPDTGVGLSGLPVVT